MPFGVVAELLARLVDLAPVPTPASAGGSGLLLSLLHMVLMAQGAQVRQRVIISRSDVVYLQSVSLVASVDGAAIAISPQDPSSDASPVAGEWRCTPGPVSIVVRHVVVSIRG